MNAVPLPKSFSDQERLELALLQMQFSVCTYVH